MLEYSEWNNLIRSIERSGCVGISPLVTIDADDYVALRSALNRASADSRSETGDQVADSWT